MCEILVVAKQQIPSEPAEIAKVLVAKAKVSNSYASELANNRRKPSLRLAVKLEKSCGIPVKFWIERDEVAA